MNKCLKVSVVVALSLAAYSTATTPCAAQRPSLRELIQNVDRAAEEQSEPKSFLGFQRVKMPKLLDGIVDLRLKKPTLPNFGFLERLKNIGKPSFEGEPTEKAPLFAGLGKLFSPQENSEPGFFGRMFNRQPESDSGNSFLSENDMNELNGIARGLQSQAKRMSRDAKDNMRELFAPTESPQPPYRTARQYQNGSSTRY